MYPASLTYRKEKGKTHNSSYFLSLFFSFCVPSPLSPRFGKLGLLHRMLSDNFQRLALACLTNMAQLLRRKSGQTYARIWVPFSSLELCFRDKVFTWFSRWQRSPDRRLQRALTSKVLCCCKKPAGFGNYEFLGYGRFSKDHSYMRELMSLSNFKVKEVSLTKSIFS